MQGAGCSVQGAGCRVLEGAGVGPAGVERRLGEQHRVLLGEGLQLVLAGTFNTQNTG